MPLELRPHNLVLASLPHLTYLRLLPHLRNCLLYPEQSLYDSNQRIERVYFINKGMVSLVIGERGGNEIEIGVIGYEGMIGTMALLTSKNSFDRAIVQVPGNACWLPMDILRREFFCDQDFQRRVFIHCQFLMAQAAQTAFCNRLHSVEQRLSRWLLTVYDRTGNPNIEITHLQIAQLQGTRRSSITLSLGELEKAGLIQTDRGSITLLDSEKIVERSCICYPRLREQFENLQQSQALQAPLGGPS